ncbi:uncharacterized protein PHALS_14534 [Plasmopara halstedii]|uniref:Uncharacterized protein n=1 Tax=Plasmopara halstedii TaxID=4781 RepID=A0A0P1AK44_PLAHL|nr:uncharacterized protein PHALS_14534 [Plasmopara halstedii]CEG41449.1 hypothetical protein PHALS_14534 [Plasmopara halstedii]|eukprot:XP_024577818.1 hypothetical protein PHALS_14534 [Plasmopara halstedii]
MELIHWSGHTDHCRLTPPCIVVMKRVHATCQFTSYNSSQLRRESFEYLHCSVQSNYIPTIISKTI